MTARYVTEKLTWLERLSRDRRLSGLAVRVGVQLATRFLNSENKKAWPSAARLARELGCTRQNAQRALARLVETGWLRYSRGGRGRSNTYWLPAVLPDSIAGDVSTGKGV